MAVTLNTYVHLHKRGMSRTIKAAAVIEDGDFADLIENPHRLYASAGLPIIASAYWPSGYSVGTSYADLFQIPVQFDERRERQSVWVEIYGTTARVRVRLYDSTYSTTWSGPTVFTGSGNLASPGAGNTDGVLLVETDDTAGAGGTLDCIVVRSLDLTLSEFP